MVSAMRTALIFATVLAACGGSPAKAPATPPAAESTSAFAPTPYTAQELRAAMPVGHVIRVKIEAAGQPPIEERWEVTAATAEDVTITTGSAAPETTRWEELRDHAKFPAAATVITDGSLGPVATKHYVVTQPDGTVETYDFSVTQAGPPLLLVSTKDGRQLVRFEVLERK